jgi:hypothetical protein
LLKGTDHPRDTDECLAFAALAYKRKHFASAARLWANALESNPQISACRKSQYRYDAACAMAMAAAGQGKGELAPDHSERAAMRSSALEWLNAELDAWSEVLDSESSPDRVKVLQSLEHWRTDPDLGSVRCTAALAKLPERERAGWRALWAAVDALIERAKQPAEA